MPPPLNTDRADLERALAKAEDLIADLGILSATIPQPSLHVDDALCQLADVPQTLRSALAELDDELTYQDERAAGYGGIRQIDEHHAGYRDQASFRVGGGEFGSELP